MGTAGWKLCVLLFGNRNDFPGCRPERDDAFADSGSRVTSSASRARDNDSTADQPEFLDRYRDVQSPRGQRATEPIAGRGWNSVFPRSDVGIVSRSEVAEHKVKRWDGWDGWDG
jgi:hypothetical protein